MRNMRSGLWIGLCFSVLSVVAFAQPSRQPTPATPDVSPMLVDCSDLDEDEQEFAVELTDSNKVLFCGKFTPKQRAAAIDLTQDPDSTGEVMTPDEAVQKIAKMGKPLPASAKNPKGCPVK